MNKSSDSKFVIRKYNIVNDQSNSSCSVGNEVIYSTEVLKPNVCDYNDAYILVIGSTTIIRHNLEIIIQKIAHHLMRVSITKSNGTTLDDAEYLALVMPMYNFLEYSSDYSDMTGSLRFYSKDKTTNFNVNIANNNSFKSFYHKVKLLGSTEFDGVDDILGNRTIVVL